MIYSTEECTVIQDVLLRKELEKSIYSSMESLSISLKSAVGSQLELDIHRCNAMLRISHNDFSNLDEDLEVLSPQEITIPMDVYEHYLSSLAEEDMRREGAFIFYCNAGLDFYCRMIRSKALAEDILAGEQLVTYSDFSKLQLLTRIFTDAKAHCLMMKGNEELPYDSAADYAGCMLDECNILKKIHLSKQMSVEELCNHVDTLDRVSPDDFNKLFMPDYPPEIKEGLESFEKKSNVRLDLLYAQILVSSKFGL